MNTIEKLLRENPHVDGWRISETATKSYELFFVHRKLETVRSTDTVETGVTVYVDHDGAMGDSSFAVYASMTEKDIAGKIESAVARARLVSNQPYQLPEGGVLNAGLPTNMKDQDMKALGLRIADAVFAADTMEGRTVRPEEAPEALGSLTARAAVAVRRAVGRCCGLWPEIKWVNDLLWQGKKLCGILCEAAPSWTKATSRCRRCTRCTAATTAARAC